MTTSQFSSPGRRRPTPLIGRDDELTEVADRLERAASGRGQVIVVTGEPGIGKTRVHDAAIDLARRLGFTVFAGACDNLAVAQPFGAFIDALHLTPGSTDPARAAIGALLAGDAVDSTGATGQATPGLHYRVMSAIEALIDDLVEAGPVLVAVDDIQWGDVSTRAAVRHLARRAPTVPLALLIVQRSGYSVPEIEAVTAEVPSPESLAVLRLSGLDDEAVAGLVSHMLSDDDPDGALIDRVRGAAGNPLFVTEYVSSVLEQHSPDDTVHTSAEFRDAVLRRLSGLPAEASELLRLASLLGSMFSPAELVAALSRPMMDLTSALHTAMDFGVLIERGDRLAFRHALVRDAVYESHPLAVRRQLHRELGEVFAAGGADVLVVAHHLRLGATAPDPEAAAWLRRAAATTAARSPGTAVELLRSAIDLLGVASPDRDAVTAELATALAWSGELSEAVDVSREMLARGCAPEVAGRLRTSILYALTWLGKAREAVQYVPEESELAAMGLDDADVTLLRAEAAVANLFAADFASARRLSAQALRDAERLGHDLAQAHALTAATWLAVFDNDAVRIEEAIAGLRHLAAGPAGPEVQLAHPHWFPAMPLCATDRLDEAEETLRTGMAVAEELGQAWSLPLYHTFLGVRHFIAGAWDVATAEFETATALAEERDGVAMEAQCTAWLSAIDVHRDDLDRAEQRLRATYARLQVSGPQLGMNLLAWAQSLLLEGRGRPDDALAHLEQSWIRAIGGGIVLDAWSATALLRLFVLAERRDDASRVVAALEEQTDRLDTPSLRALVLRGRGLIAGDPDVLVAAVEEMRLSPRRPETADTCVDAATALAACGRLEEAVALWDEALAVYEDLDAARDIAIVRAQLRANGVRRSRRSRHARATSGWDSLTPAERAVVDLVAQRLTNGEVAERLFISRHTVESHLKSVYRKLAIGSRVELATLAANRPR